MLYINVRQYLPWQPVSGYLLGLMNVRLGRFSPGEMNQPLLKAAGHRDSFHLD
jgi:apolipoprotein N-acyltransferase